MAPRRGILLLAAVLLALAGCGGADTFTLQGSITVPSRYSPGDRCVAGDGYRDVRVGATVTVTDAAGTVLAVGVLDAPTTTETLVTGEYGGSIRVTVCRFPFTVQVPAGEDVYGVEVTHRGTVHVPAAQARSPVMLTLTR